jgi:hypothetical protein
MPAPRTAELTTLAIHPEPGPQPAEEDESHGAGPERYIVAARHLHSEDDVKQLRKGDEPEQNRSDKQRRLPHLSVLPSLPGLTCRTSEKSRLLTPDLVASRMGKAEHAWAFDFGFHRGRINRPPAHVTPSSCSPAYGGNARGWKQPALKQADTDQPPQLIVGRRDRLDASPRAIRSATGELAALDCCSEDGLV